MKARSFPPNEIPYFSYDRKMTTQEIQTLLSDVTSSSWSQTAAWVMREAAFPDVWHFLTPLDVADHLDELTPWLGNKADFWKYIIEVWSELGKLGRSDAA